MGPEGERLSRRRFLRLGGAAAASLVLAYVVRRELTRGPHCLWGAFVQPRSGEDQQRAIEDFEAAIGRKLAITRHYARWDVRLPTGPQAWTAMNGRIPLIAWNARLKGGAPVIWASIAGGAQDRWIAEQGARLARLGRPVWFSFNHEPEGDPEKGTAPDYVAAWDHVKSIFDSVGASNLTWVHTLTAATFHGGNGGPGVWTPPHYDLLGVDGYNRFPCYSRRWRSFEEIFASAQSFAVSTGAGLVVQEVGTLEQTDCGNAAGDPDAKARWFTDMAATIKSWPQVKAVEYSHTRTEYRGRPMAFWVDTSPQSLASYKSVGLDPYFM